MGRLRATNIDLHKPTITDKSTSGLDRQLGLGLDAQLTVIFAGATGRSQLPPFLCHRFFSTFQNFRVECPRIQTALFHARFGGSAGVDGFEAASGHFANLGSGI